MPFEVMICFFLTTFDTTLTLNTIIQNSGDISWESVYPQ